ncbi:MAG: hypothetical protein K8S23_08050 [Candidatus Cloacimonetes bacterium]|nr:hypothetical protein [Candidatus Cloacimonadota bacterium]
MNSIIKIDKHLIMLDRISEIGKIMEIDLHHQRISCFTISFKDDTMINIYRDCDANNNLNNIEIQNIHKSLTSQIKKQVRQ